ncbi:MAG: hypothetical protein CR981_00765 [Proteobacteria bacterium]|nr:MAG: hypothetical protein CR981_00765 [Pseudomonadota bacterium]PIE65243.1 MAG: hypothetical protein CSA26_04005 [Desulfobacterales bacterium]
MITTVTTSTTPVVDLDDVNPGCHIDAVGAFKPTMQEVGSRLIIKARVVVDSLPACLEETGDLPVPVCNGEYERNEIFGELGEIVTGEKQGRTDAGQITFFESVVSLLKIWLRRVWGLSRCGYR